MCIRDRVDPARRRACSGLASSRSLHVSALAHQLGHRALDWIAALAKASHDPGPVLARPVLTHLPLALDARDRNLDPDDRAELGLDVARRRVADLPRRG